MLVNMHDGVADARIKQAADIVPTANEIIDAVRACSELDDEGRWSNYIQQTTDDAPRSGRSYYMLE